MMYTKLGILIISAMLCISANSVEPGAQNDEADEFSPDRYIYCEESDVTGDGTNEKVCISGDMAPGKFPNYTLEIMGSDHIPVFSSLVSEKGLAPELFIKDFNQDGIEDVFVRFEKDNTRGGVTYNLISYRNGSFEEIPLPFSDPSNELETIITGDRVRIKSKTLQTEYRLQISDEIRNLYEKMKADCQDNCGSYYLLGLDPTPMDEEGNVFGFKSFNNYELSYRDNVARVELVYKFNGTEWEVVEMYSEAF